MGRAVRERMLQKGMKKRKQKRMPNRRIVAKWSMQWPMQAMWGRGATTTRGRSVRCLRACSTDGT